MRVVGGEARGRRLVAPPGRAARPTTDRVREAVFNALASMAVIDDATVVDLFAGSGALGIEALSRGAHHVSFVDRDPASCAAVRANLGATGLTDRASVISMSAERFLRELPAGRAFGLALLDPPYVFDDWADLLADLPAGTAVIETDRSVDVPAPWEVVRTKWYGSTLVLIAVRGPTVT